MTPEDEARAALRFIPFDMPVVDDSCITVALIGRESEQFWAKATGDYWQGCPVYKLLPMERG